MKIDFKVVFGAIGAVASGVVGFLVGKHFGRNKGYSEALERYLEVNGDPSEGDISVNPPADDPEPEKPLVVRIIEEEKMYPYDFDEVEVVDETIESYTKQSNKKKKRPYMIDPDIAGTDGYELRTVHFHKKSNTVTNDDDTEEVVNVKYLIGFDVLNELDSYEESITLYVRNELEATDYEVISIDDEWGGSD